DERGWEWDYWDRMCHLDLRTLEGHTSSVNGIAFSPDSSQIASASTDGTIKLWETATGRLIRTIEGHRAPVTSIAFHPDGKTIGAGDAKNFAILWDSHTGQELHKLQHDFAINCVAFSPNGDLFATGTLRSKEGSHRMIWRVADGSQVKSFSKPNQVRSISFNGDGTRIICATDPDIESWEIESGQLSIIASHRTMKDNNFEFEQVTSAIVSPDQKTLVTASMDRAVKIWDMDSKRELLSIPAHREGITSVAINASENMIASASVDRSIRVWNSITGTEQLVLRGHSGAVQQVAFSPDGFRLASASRDGTVKIWDSTLRMDFRALLASYSCHYLSHSFRPEGNEIVYGRFLNGIGDIGPLAEVRDASSHELIREFHGGHRHWIRSIVMSSDGKLLATAGGDSVLIRNMVTGENLHEIKGIPRVLNGGLLFSPDGTLLVVQFPDVDKQNNRIIPSQKVYDTATGKQLYGRIANVGCVAFTRDGGMLAIASKESIEFIEPKTGSTIRSWKHAGNATNLHYSPDGKFLAANTKTTDVCMWDASTGRLIREISNAGKLIGFSPTGLRVFSVPQRESLNVWDVTTGDLLCIIASPKRSTFSESAISADGSLIAIRNIPDIDILDVRPLTKEINVQRETQSLAAKLLKSPFGEPPQLLERKSEVLARLKEIKSVPEAVRQSAARLIEATLRPYDESMELVYVAGGLLEGDDLTDPTRPTYSDGTGLPTLEQSKLALEYAVKAFEIDENVFSTGTLGTAPVSYT
ncbi:MAG: WD40 repeat domain-containing protein, partial [Pirellula sp.]